MKQAIKALAFTQINDYFGESERSGDPRRDSIHWCSIWER